MGTIYLITNRINGKAYVGQTSKPLAKRFGQHCARRKTAVISYVNRAICRYGIGAFDIQALEVDAPDLDVAERYWITWYGTKAPLGYNLTEGGCGVRDYKFSHAARAKMSAAARGRPKSIEQRAKMSEAARRRPRPTEAERLVLSLAQSKRWATKRAVKS